MFQLRGGRFPATIALTLTLLLAGCAPLELGRIGEAWAKNECLRNPDEVSRTRCVESSTKAYEESRRQSARSKEQGSPSNSATTGSSACTTSFLLVPKMRPNSSLNTDVPSAGLRPSQRAAG